MSRGGIEPNMLRTMSSVPRLYTVQTATVSLFHEGVLTLDERPKKRLFFVWFVQRYTIKVMRRTMGPIITLIVQSISMSIGIGQSVEWTVDTDDAPVDAMDNSEFAHMLPFLLMRVRNETSYIVAYDTRVSNP